MPSILPGLLVALLVVPPIGKSNDAPFAGDPPTHRMIPALQVYPQNFALAQAPDGVIYVGNHDGVLTFNGEHWDHLPLPNGDIVRSLAATESGRVYVGGYDLFGYLERDAAGREQFHDLVPLFSPLLEGESFADIWTVQLAPEGVFFRGVRHVFLYDPEDETVSLWRHADRFGGMARFNDMTVLQFRGEGLRYFDDGQWRALAGTTSLTSLVPQLIPLSDGSLLLLSAGGEWHRYRDGHVVPFEVPAGFPPSSQITRGVQTDDGRIALATTDGALIILDAERQTARRFELADGYISAVLRAGDGSILMSSNDAVLRVEWPPRLTVLGSEHGLAGTVHGFSQWNARWHVLTGAGVFAWTPAGADRFERREWTNHEAWDLLELDEQTALLAESYSLLLVDEGTVQALSDATLYPRVLHRSAFDDATVYVGTELGLAMFRRINGKWQPVFVADDMGAPGVSSLVQPSQRELWLGTERGGVIQARLSPAGDAIEDLRHLNAGDGIEYGLIRAAAVTVLPGTGLTVSTHRGFFTWDGTRFTPVSLDGLDQLRGSNELLQITARPDGSRWAYSYSRVFQQLPGSDWIPDDVNEQRRGAIQTVAFDDSGAAIFGATSSILRRERLVSRSPVRPPQVALTRVEKLQPEGSLEALPLATAQPLEFSFQDANIAFHFALPEFVAGNTAPYSARLIGLESQWSPWSASSGYTYFRLRPGDYQFELRARDQEGRITSTTPWQFRVLPNWYARPLFLFLWVALSVLLLATAMHWVSVRRTGRLAVEKAKLEEMIAERTRELEAANRKLENIAHLDSLTEIPNRRRLDEYLARAWQQCVDRARPLSLLVIDVDRFKQYNDEFGHLAGDRLLRRLAGILSRTLRRADDLVARYGGEEFLVVLPGADRETAQELAETMRNLVESGSLGTTISIGVASVTPTSRDSLTSLVRMADAALYDAKSAGRNCVQTADA